MNLFPLIPTLAVFENLGPFDWIGLFGLYLLFYRAWFLILLLFIMSFIFCHCIIAWVMDHVHHVKERDLEKMKCSGSRHVRARFKILIYYQYILDIFNICASRYKIREYISINRDFFYILLIFNWFFFYFFHVTIDISKYFINIWYHLIHLN